MNKTFILIIAVLLFLSWSCTNRNNTVKNNSKDEDSTESLSPLEGGTFYFKSKNPFDTLILFEGDQLFKNSIIFSTNSNLTIKDNLLFINELRVDENEYQITDSKFTPPFINNPKNRLLLISYPSLELIKNCRFEIGRQESDFFPTIVPVQDSSAFCYLFENNIINGKMYKLGFDGIITSISYPFFEQLNPGSNISNIIYVASGTFIFTKDSGYLVNKKFISHRKIFKVSQQGEHFKIKEIYDLNTDVSDKNRMMGGSLVVNVLKNRIMYVYDRHKIIRFMDLDAKTVKTINFEKDSSTISDINFQAIHSIGIRDNSVYIKYVFLPPVDDKRRICWKDSVIVEQYDWNGNPGHKYQLKRDGYYLLDDSCKKMIFKTNLPFKYKPSQSI